MSSRSNRVLSPTHNQNFHVKTNPLLLSLLLIASHGFATETSSTESRETSADVKPHPLSKYIYQEGLGYSLNVKPYKWQSDFD